MNEQVRNILTVVSLVFSLVALVISLSHKASSPTPSVTPPTTIVAPQAQKTTAVSPTSEQEVEKLTQRISELEKTIEREKMASRPTARASTTENAASSAAGRATTTDIKKYARFEAPSSAVKITQDATGSLSVTNTDASITGQIMTIQGVDSDGNKVPIPITIPPPLGSIPSSPLHTISITSALPCAGLV